LTWVVAKPKVTQTFTQFLVKILQIEKRRKKANKRDDYLDDVKISKENPELRCIEPPLTKRTTFAEAQTAAVASE
jgi:hypothetical protein